jgi:hypothetical protein
MLSFIYSARFPAAADMACISACSSSKLAMVLSRCSGGECLLQKLTLRMTLLRVSGSVSLPLHNVFLDPHIMHVRAPWF